MCWSDVTAEPQEDNPRKKTMDKSDSETFKI
jgi:hypothetical protein